MNLRAATLDHVAGAYVLGILTQRARRRFIRLLQTEPAARAGCDRWEERLVGLYLALPSVRPETSTWGAIVTRLQSRASGGVRPARRRQLLAAAIAGTVLAVCWFYFRS